MKKAFNFLSLSLALTTFAHYGTAASGTGINPDAYRDGFEGRELRHMPTTSAASTITTLGAPSVILPPLNIGAIRTYLAPITVPIEGLPPALTSLELVAADIYGVVGVTLAGVAAMNPGEYSKGTILTEGQLMTARIPAIFTGWKVVGVVDGMNPEKRTASTSTNSTTASALGADNFDAKYPNIFGLALEAPAAADGTSFRWCFLNSPLPKTLKELLLGSLSMLRKGDPIAARRECRTRVMTNMNISSENLDRLGFPKAAEVLPTEAARERDEMVDRRRLWMDKCIKKLNPWLCEMKPHGAAGHSVAGAYLNVMLRAMETSGGEPAEMARSIQFVRIFNASGTSLLVELTKGVLHGEGSIEIFDKPHTSTMYTMTGADAERFGYFNRDTDVFGETGITFGRVRQLPDKPTMLRAAPSMGRIIPAPVPAPVTGGWGIWNALSRAASAVTGAFTTTTAPEVTLADLQDRILTIHGIRGMMSDMLLLYRELNPLFSSPSAASPVVTSPTARPITWEEAIATSVTSAGEAGVAIRDVWT